MCSRPVSLHLDALDPAQVVAVAAATAGVSDWLLTTAHEQEAQLYLIGERVEARRVVSGGRTRLTVYNDHPVSSGEGSGGSSGGGVARGATTVTLLDADAADPAALAARLRDAVAAAELTDNPPYPVPGMPADGYPAVVAFDAALAGDLAAVVDALAARLQAAVAAEEGVRLSSAELYATRAARTLRNSRGVDASGQDTQVMLDLVLIAGEGEGEAEAEMHGEFTRRRLTDLDIEALVRLYAAYARHTLRASTPATFRGPVVLSGKAVADMFNHPLGSLAQDPYTAHSSGQAAYQGISRFTAGGFTCGEEPRGDRLTLMSDPLRPFGGATVAFGADGLPLRRLNIIENGVFVAPWTDARYAAYLGTTPTGAFANPTITPGSTPLRALRDGSAGTVYEVAEFSFLDPDPISGDFVAEIKLGYRHDASGAHPIKGGSVAGNVFTAFADARFSSETYTDGTYLGPAGIRFGELTVSGD